MRAIYVLMTDIDSTDRYRSYELYSVASTHLGSASGKNVTICLQVAPVSRPPSSCGVKLDLDMAFNMHPTIKNIPLECFKSWLSIDYRNLHPSHSGAHGYRFLDIIEHRGRSFFCATRSGCPETSAKSSDIPEELASEGAL